MIVNMSDSATEQQIEHIIQRIREAGFQPHVTRGTERTIVRPSVAVDAAMRLRHSPSRPVSTMWSRSPNRLSWLAVRPVR